jgi:hypothetical protein
MGKVTMSNRTHLFILLVLMLTIAAAIVVPASYANNLSSKKSTDTTSDNINDAENTIEHYKKEIETIQNRIQRYKKMADDARAQEKESTHEADKKHWRDSAKNREKLAADLQSDIEKLQAKVKDEETTLGALKDKRTQDTVQDIVTQTTNAAKNVAHHAEKQTHARNERNQNTCQFTASHDIIGLWVYADDEDAEPLAIVQKNPNLPEYPNDLEMHSKDRTWAGKFNSEPNLPADQPRMTFKYKPQAGEINENIPDEVAAAIEGQLEWEVEILPDCQNGAQMLYAMFYPGEVEWNEDDLSDYEISGRGKGRRFDLNPVVDINSALAYETAIAVEVDKNTNAFINPPSALIQGQRFNISVRLAPEEAKRAGKSITVKLEGLSGGESDTIKLTAKKAKKGLPVYYSHKKPAKIMDSKRFGEESRNPHFLSFGWMFGAGERFDLDTKDGEHIRFSYKDVNFEIPVYDSVYSRGHARYVQAAAQQRAIYQSMLDNDAKISIVSRIDGSESPAKIIDQDAIKKSLQMIRNYELLISSDKLHIPHKYKIGMEYFGGPNTTGLLDLSSKQISAIEEHQALTRHLDNQTYKTDPLVNPLMKAALEGMMGRKLKHAPTEATKDSNIQWAYDLERVRVTRSIKNTSEKMREDFLKDYMKTLSYALYAGVLAIPAAGEDMVIILEGVDAHGKKKKKWERINAAVSVGAGSLLTISTSGIAKHISDQAKFQKTLANTKISNNAARHAGLTDEITDTAKTKNDFAINDNMTTGQRDQTRLEFTPEANAVLLPGAKYLSFEEDTAKAFKNAINKLEHDKSIKKTIRPRYLRDVYPDTLRVVEVFSDKISVQSSNSICQGKVLSWLYFKDTGKEIAEETMHDYIMKMANSERRVRYVDELEKLGYNAASAWKLGYPNFLIRKVARALGYSVLETQNPLINNRKLGLKHIARLRKEGYHVKIVADFHRPSGELIGRHALSVEEVITNSRGYAEKVRFYDSNVASILELPADDFKKLIIQNEAYGNITVLKGQPIRM